MGSRVFESQHCPVGQSGGTQFGGCVGGRILAKRLEEDDEDDEDDDGDKDDDEDEDEDEDEDDIAVSECGYAASLRRLESAADGPIRLTQLTGGSNSTMEKRVVVGQKRSG